MTTRQVIGITGGSGGLGASVLTVALAVRAASRGLVTTAIDLDPHGSGLDLVAGVEHVTGLRWGDLADLQGAADGSAIRARLPQVGAACVLCPDGSARTDLARGRLPDDAVTVEVIRALGEASDLTVVDIPHHHAPSTWLADCLDRVVVLSGMQPHLAARGLARIQAWSDLHPRVMATLRSGGFSSRSVSAVSAHLGVPMLPHVDDDPDLSSALSRGSAPGGHDRQVLSRAAERLLDALGVQTETRSATRRRVA